LDFSTFGGRDVIILAVILIAVYLLVSLLRLSQIKRRQKAAGRAAPAVDAKDISGAAPAQPESGTQSVAEEAYTYTASAHAAPLSFGEQLFRSGVEAELQRMRKDIAELKEALAQVNASRRVSPQYNEAMQLAQRGMNAQIIADECAISIGEAELVVALSRNRQEYEDYDSQYDGRE